MKTPGSVGSLAWEWSGMALVALVTGLSSLAIGGETSVNGRTFTLPPGFSIERVAGPPLVDRPIVADFDDRGRLYVADSSGSNDPVAKQLAERPHQVVRLEDSDGDGTFDRRTVFADRMMLPEGAMWLDGSLYVSAPPSIWKLTDTDDDGVADQRVEWYQGKTLGGCANDLHGPYPGPDGWIYWAKGGFQAQTHDRPGKSPFLSRAAHLLRCRADGTGLELVMTGGMDNPVDVVFTPGGERIFSCTFLQHPEGGRRDGLIHAVYGGIYGKVHDVLDNHPHTTPGVLPAMAHLGPAAPSGLTNYESNVFGPGFRDNLFTCCFNLQKVTRSVLTPAGATFTSVDEDFLTCLDRDFHPTDVLEDADGSLLVVDTGGWYKLCCPTSQLEKPDVLGAIYRVRRTGAPQVVDPRGLTLGWASMTADEMTGLLGDPRPAVRRRAMAGLAKRGSKAVPALARTVRDGRTPESRRNAIWAATRIGGPEARQATRNAFDDPDPSVRQVAIHSASVRVDRESLPGLIRMLKNPSAQNRRVAAEAIGRIADPSAVPDLLAAIGATDDRVLDHSLTYALIQINDPKGTAQGLTAQESRTRRAALIALDQADARSLGPDSVAGWLSTADPDLKQTASWIAGRHPEWGEALAQAYRRRLAEPSLTKAELDDLADQLGRFAASPAIQDLITDRLLDGSAPRASRLVALRAVAVSRLKVAPAGWSQAMGPILIGDDEELVRAAIAGIRSLNLPGDRLGPPLLAIAGQANRPDSLRLEALAAIPPKSRTIGPELFSFLKSRLEPGQPVSSRTLAADILAGSPLDLDQLDSLTMAVEAAGPMEVNRLLPAFQGRTDDRVGRKLVEALGRSSARSTFRADVLRALFSKFGTEVRQQAEELCLTLNADASAQKARLEQTLKSMVGGDVRRGQLVFNSPKAACSSCHAIGYLGGKVGPDLSRIGQIRTERDLLEAILFPSVSFARSYEPVVVATREGKVLSGILRLDSAHEVVLATGANEEARIARDDIEEIRPGTVSVMPSGLDQQLTPDQLADLVAFLKSRR